MKLRQRLADGVSGRKLQAGLITALLGAAPLVIVGGWSPHDTQRILQVLLIGAVGAISLTSFAKDAGRELPLLMRLVVAIVALLAIGSAYLSTQPVAAFQELGLMLGLLLLLNAARTRAILPDDIWMARGVVIGTGTYVTVTLVVFIAAAAQGSTLYLSALIIGFDNYRFLNHAQTLFIPILATVAVGDREAIWRRSALITLVAHFALLALTRGRATAIGLTAATIFAAFLFKSAEARRLIRKVFESAIAGGLIFVVLFIGLPRMLGLKWGEQSGAFADVASGDERLLLWRNAIAAIWKSPWFGLGPMHFAELHLTPGAHPHNIYLQWAAEYGIPASALIAFCLIWCLRLGATHLRANLKASTFSIGIWMGCLAAAIDGLLSGNFVMPLSQCWIAVAFGLMLRTALPFSDHPPNCSGRFAFAIVCLTGIGGLTFLTAVDAVKVPPRVGELQEILPDERVTPRFWLNGRI